MKILTFLNQLKDFLKNVSQDERIPQRDKKILVAMIALVLSPIDLLPDWIPIFGQLDDLIIISIILDYFFKVLDSTVLLSHFPWDMKAYARLKSIANLTQFFVPKFIRKKIWSYVGAPY